MKVLYVIDSLRSGGKERRLVALLKSLKDSVVEPSLIVLKKEIHYEDIFKLDIPLHFLPRNFWSDITIFSQFIKILNDFKPDIVHSWDNIATLHFSILCKIKGIRFIDSSISAAPELSIFSKRFLSSLVMYPFSDVILSNSAAGLRSFRTPKNKSVFIHNGFDPERVKKLQNSKYLKSVWDITSKYIVGMVASFSDMKDYDTFIDAGEIVLQKGYDVTFICVGNGINFERIKKKVEKYNKNRFIFTGKQKDVESFVNIFDIGVLSTYTEGISNSIMEYMALGKPVIATKGGGTSELVVENETGFLVGRENPMELSEKIIFLLEKPEYRVMFGNNGKARILSEFSIEKMFSRTLELYTKVLEKK